MLGASIWKCLREKIAHRIKLKPWLHLRDEEVSFGLFPGKFQVRFRMGGWFRKGGLSILVSLTLWPYPTVAARVRTTPSLGCTKVYEKKSWFKAAAANHWDFKKDKKKKNLRSCLWNLNHVKKYWESSLFLGSDASRGSSELVSNIF